MSMAHGYLVPGVGGTRYRYTETGIDQEDIAEQIREEAYTDAWETTLSKAQYMVDHPDNKKMIADIVDRIAMIIIKENHNVE